LLQESTDHDEDVTLPEPVFVVNRYCLLASLDAAVDAAKLFQAEQPEPGTYLIVRVEASTPILPL